VTTKYTPGPWSWDTDPNGDRWIIGDKSTWVPRIAKIPRYSEMPNEANARLIAAAPELVEALRELTEKVSADAINRARSLLARIEGGAA
jgi:hypothetical protein